MNGGKQHDDCRANRRKSLRGAQSEHTACGQLWGKARDGRRTTGRGQGRTREKPAQGVRLHTGRPMPGAFLLTSPVDARSGSDLRRWQLSPRSTAPTATTLSSFSEEQNHNSWCQRGAGFVSMLASWANRHQAGLGQGIIGSTGICIPPYSDHYTSQRTGGGFR